MVQRLARRAIVDEAVHRIRRPLRGPLASPSRGLGTNALNLAWAVPLKRPAVRVYAACAGCDAVRESPPQTWAGSIGRICSRVDFGNHPGIGVDQAADSHLCPGDRAGPPCSHPCRGSSWIIARGAGIDHPSFSTLSRRWALKKTAPVHREADRFDDIGADENEPHSRSVAYRAKIGNSGVVRSHVPCAASGRAFVARKHEVRPKTASMPVSTVRPHGERRFGEVSRILTAG